MEPHTSVTFYQNVRTKKTGVFIYFMQCCIPQSLIQCLAQQGNPLTGCSSWPPPLAVIGDKMVMRPGLCRTLTFSRLHCSSHSLILSFIIVPSSGPGWVPPNSVTSWRECQNCSQKVTELFLEKDDSSSLLPPCHICKRGKDK